VAFDIAGVTIERAALSVSRPAERQEIALSDLKLETGRIAENAEGKLEFATALKRNTPPLDAKLALNGRYALKPESVALDFTAKLDESTIKGKAAMARAKVAAYEFDLNIDKLNLDRYLASSEKKQEKKGRSRRSPPQGQGRRRPGRPLRLKGLNAKGKVEIGALQVQGLKLAR
jgi:AsmA protein